MAVAGGLKKVPVDVPHPFFGSKPVVHTEVHLTFHVFPRHHCQQLSRAARLKGCLERTLGVDSPGVGQ